MLIVPTGAAGSLPSATLAKHAGQSPSGVSSGSGCRHCWQSRIVSVQFPFAYFTFHFLKKSSAAMVAVPALERLARLPLRGPALSALVENRPFRRQSSLESKTLTRPAPAQIAGKKRALDTPNG